MKPIDFAWSSLQSITQKRPNQVKLLVDEIEYPTLETDSYGFVVHLASPKKQTDNLFSLHGMYFDNDKKGRSSLWRMFRASVYHLALHVITSDFEIYRGLAESTRSMNNLMFAVSQVEDHVIRGHMRARWPGLLLDTIYASQVSALRFRDIIAESSVSTKITGNLLSYSLTGAPIVGMGKEIDESLRSLHDYLVDLEVFSEKFYSIPAIADVEYYKVLQMSSKKVTVAKKILSLLEEQSVYLAEIPTPPFTDNHGTNKFFQNSTAIGGSENFDSVLKDTYSKLSLGIDEAAIHESERLAEIEAQTALSDWEYSLIAMKRLSELHRSLDPKTHFENFIFPNEDYAEFVRTRSKVIGPIRMVLDQLRRIIFTEDETQGKESGQVDIPAAIQVLASKSSRNDVFVREEVEKRSQSWAILIDSSKSLDLFRRDVGEIAVCMSEVAKDLIPNPHSWACYSFNENMYIIKDFSEIYGTSAKARIGGLTLGLKTYLPDALRVVAKRLRETTEDVKVLLVASDGFPLGYEGIEKEMFDTMGQISRSGIQLVGLGVGSSSIQKYFRSNVTAYSPSDLMKHFVKTYMELAGSF